MQTPEQRDRAGRREAAGFTLLEVVLALALTVVVLYMVTMAVGLHLRMLDAGRTEVEEATLARALLRRIANDLRGAVQYDPIDTEAGASGSGSGGVSSEEADSEDGTQEDYGVGEQAETTEDIAESTAVASLPGIVGNGSQIQIDVARLPRVDRFLAAMSADHQTAPSDPLSNVKTVAYYLVTAGESAGAGGLETRTGLIRRELDRAVTCYASQNGGLLRIELELEPIAPEVRAIEFRYYDGSQWLESWDTQAQGGLPVAVDVAIAVGRMCHESRGLASWMGGDEEERESDRTLYYRLLVDLPAAAQASDATAEVMP